MAAILVTGAFACVLRRGILVDGCTDIGRIENRAKGDVKIDLNVTPKAGRSKE